MCSSGPSMNRPAVAPEAPSSAPDSSKSAGASSRKELAKRRAATLSGTLLTGGQGLTSAANTAQKTLLGA